MNHEKIGGIVGIRTDEVGHVANKPDDEKGHAEAICALGLVVLEQLRELQRILKLINHRNLKRRTKRHIQAVKLMLPKIPETACVQSKLRAATAKAAVARRGGIAIGGSVAKMGGGGVKQKRRIRIRRKRRRSRREQG